MGHVDKQTLSIVNKMRHNPSNIRFSELCRVCDCIFGKARMRSTSHRVYKMPWSGDPRINIQDNQGKAKVYQVKQVLKATDKWVDENGR